MLRILLFYILPFLLPFIGFFTYRFLVTDGRAFLQNTPWFVLSTAGLALVIVSLFTLALTGGWDTEGDYAPPRLEDGRIVPGEVRVPAAEVPAGEAPDAAEPPADAEAAPAPANGN
jgi:hypothetical protein